MSNEKNPLPTSRAYWVILLFGLICIALLLINAYFLILPSSRTPILALALKVPKLRDHFISQLIAEHPGGLYDTHIDADVGRINLPNLKDRHSGRDLISTNRFGIREREYALPKPPGVIRIVILGDSFVYGYGVSAEDRLGAYLERWLRDRSPHFKGHIECLHIGIPSWNIIAESSYLRRQISELLPDLVIHLLVPNDIEDCAGTRGFGQMSRFSTQLRQRADSMISAGFPIRVLGFERPGYVRHAFDYEGQNRYRSSLAEIRRLANAIESVGGKYRLLLHYRRLLPTVWKHLGRHLDPKLVVYLANTFGSDQKYWNSKTNYHWNRAGHIKMAKLVYGLITKDELLPRVNPLGWDEASQAVDEIATAGRTEAERSLSEDELFVIAGSPRIGAILNFTELNAHSAAQIHGGIDIHGRVSPYASILLKNDGGKKLRIEGSTFPRPELDGTYVRVFIDAEPVGEFKIQENDKLDLSYELPRSVADRPYLSVRLEASDYIYQGRDLQHCVVFVLKRIAIEP